jgi:iron(III) transport system permease protein
MRELSMVVILTTPGTELLTTLTFRYSDYGFYHMSNAVVLLLVVIIVVMQYIMQKITGSDLSEGLGG